jgi:hypothetical protein
MIPPRSPTGWTLLRGSTGTGGWRLRPASPDWPTGEHPAELPDDEPARKGEDAWADGVDLTGGQCQCGG